MLDAQSVYEIAKHYRAEITAGRQIKWLVTENSHGEWTELMQYRPSVLDSVILAKSWRMPGYLAAAKAATMWPNDMIEGFLQAMLLGRPTASQEMRMENFQHWKGQFVGFMVIQKLRGEWREAEAHFS
jgi:hypothetical protein